MVSLDFRSTEYVPYFLLDKTDDQSPNAFLAYQEGGKVLQGLVDGSVSPFISHQVLSNYQVELDQDTVDGARALLTYEYARKSETVIAAASSAYLNEVLKGVGKNFDQEMLKRLPVISLCSPRLPRLCN